MSEFLLPDVGEGLTEAEIVAWKVKVGDTVEINDVIVEIETAKSLVELPSPFEGTVLALLVPEGETIPVGTPIISIGAEGEAPAPSAPASSGDSAPATQTESDPYLGMAQKAGAEQVDPADIDLSNPAASGSMEGASLVGRIKADRGPMRRARRGSASPSTVAGSQTQLQVQGAFAPGGAQSDEVMPADESPVPATDQRPAPAAAPAEALVPPAAQEVVYKHYVNLGIAAATPRGLVVPNVKDADALSMTELARALGELTATARDGKTQPAEMAGGTFTITNVGVFGVDAGTPIINPGESAILCFGAINKRPWVDEETGEIVVRDVTTLALSFDHRHIDGEKGSRFLADVAGMLQDPGTALLF